MILIIGGCYQGKRELAKAKFSLLDTDCFECSDYIDYSYKAIFGLEQFFLHLIKNDQLPSEYVKENLDKFKDKIIVIADISSGIVPIDPVMRAWREETGRSTVIISNNSAAVYRAFCGIPTRLK